MSATGAAEVLRSLLGECCGVLDATAHGEPVEGDLRWRIRTTLAALRGQGEAVEMSPEFTDTARAALAWVLWHHQGASSEIGNAIRFALGMGSHDRMPDAMVAEAKRWRDIAKSTTPLAPQQGEADELLAALGLDASRFRTEGGFLIVGKVVAAIKHPGDYAGYYITPPPSAVPEAAETLRRCLHWAVGVDAAGWESWDGWPLGRFLVPALAGDIEAAARELAAHEAEYNAALAEAELAAAQGPGKDGAL